MKRTKESRHLILFMTLGDGCLEKDGCLSILHSEKQKDYLEWKHRLLKTNGITCGDMRYKNNNGYPAYRFSTRTHNFIKLYRKALYTPKKDIANRKLLNKLTPLGIAIWYMDDGGLSQKKRNGEIYANNLMINTHLTKEENQIIIDYFNEVWNVKFNQYKNRGKYRLACGTKEARKFIEIVKPYVSQVPSMQHKLNVIEKGSYNI